MKRLILVLLFSAVSSYAQFIAGVSSNATQTSATISWTTPVATSGSVSYGLSAAYGNTTPPGSSQNVVLSGLQAGTTYHYRIVATDSLGESTSSIDRMFTTLGSTTTNSIAFIQGCSATPNVSSSTVSCTFSKTQKAGDFNIVAIGWNSASAKVSSVSDSGGDAYSLACGPEAGNQLQHSIYYARNITAASGTRVTVTFNAATPYPDLRIAEYSGLNALESCIGSIGTSSLATSGNLMTQTANDLIVGAGITFGAFTSAGAGFTTRMISNDGNILEDGMTGAPGSYAATATQTSKWIMQAAAFSPSPQDDPPATAPSPTMSYSTNFPNTENPLSESGNWIDGGANGLDWTDCRSTPGFAFGTQVGNVSYNDSICQLLGTWPANQAAQGVIRILSGDSTTYEEAEIFVHLTISPHSTTGYEINCSLKSGEPYVSITRWNGAMGNFTELAVNRSTYCVNGDVLGAAISGSTINAYKNGKLMVSATDGTFTNGSPGMGFSLGGGTGTVGNFGFSSYTAGTQ